MNLLYLASIDFPLVKARAVQVINTCHALAEVGCQVTLVVGQREPGPLERYLPRYGLTARPTLRLVGIPALRLPQNSPAPLRRYYTRCWNWTFLAGCLARLPALLRHQPAVVLARDYRLAWLLLRLPRRFRRPLVFEVHGLPSVELLDTGRPAHEIGGEVARRKQLEQRIFDGAWRLITITECLRQRLIDDYGVSPERVYTVPDGSRAGFDKTASSLGPGPGPAKHEQQPPASMATLAYAGQLYEHKGVDLLLKALVEVPRGELLIIGGLPDDPQRARLERLASELGVAERVRFSGPQPYEKIASLLARADIALLPLAEGVVARCFTSPLKLFDYLAAGLPIVAVDYPTIREVVRDGENGLLVPPNDPAALARAIIRLLDDQDLAGRLGRQAFRDSDDFTWRRRAERLLAALGEPMANEARLPAVSAARPNR